MISAFKISILFAIFFTITKATDVKWCVDNILAQQKCKNFAEKLTGYKLTCKMESDCIANIKNDKVDITVLTADDYAVLMKAEKSKFDTIAFEKYQSDDVIVAVIDKNKVDKIDTLPLNFPSKDDIRNGHAALLIKMNRLNPVCGDVTPTPGADTIQLKSYLELNEDDKTNNHLVCVENEKIVHKPISEYKNCNVEANIPNAVIIKNNSDKKETIKKMIEELGELGHDTLGKYGDKSDLIFRDETVGFIYQIPNPNGVTLDVFDKLHCGEYKH